MPLALALLLITGATGAGAGGGGCGGGVAAGAIANASVALPVPPAFVAVNVRLKFPGALGVPLINPLVVLIVKPDGKPMAP